MQVVSVSDERICTTSTSSPASLPRCFLISHPILTLHRRIRRCMNQVLDVTIPRGLSIRRDFRISSMRNGRFAVEGLPRQGHFRCELLGYGRVGLLHEVQFGGSTENAPVELANQQPTNVSFLCPSRVLIRSSTCQLLIDRSRQVETGQMLTNSSSLRTLNATLLVSGKIRKTGANQCRSCSLALLWCRTSWVGGGRFSCVRASSLPHAHLHIMHLRVTGALVLL